MIGGLVLALVSAALINLGFLLQHRGLADATGAGAGGMLRRLRRSLRNPVWLSGQALGWLGFGLQIVAVVIAPLALVQAFAAGGLALSVPLAAGVFRHRVTRGQVLAVLVIAAGLAALPIGFSTVADRLQPGRLTAALAVGAVAAVALERLRAPAARAAAAGMFYGLADAAIKAVSLDWHHHGASEPGERVGAGGRRRHVRRLRLLPGRARDRRGGARHLADDRGDGAGGARLRPRGVRGVARSRRGREPDARARDRGCARRRPGARRRPHRDRRIR